MRSIFSKLLSKLKNQRTQVIVFGSTAGVILMALFTNFLYSNDPKYLAYTQSAINSGLYTVRGLQIKFELVNLGATGPNGQYFRDTNTIQINVDSQELASLTDVMRLLNHELGHAWWSANEHWLGIDNIIDRPSVVGGLTETFDSEPYGAKLDIEQLNESIAIKLKAGDIEGAKTDLTQLQFREAFWKDISISHDLFGTFDSQEIKQGLIANNGTYNGLTMRNAADLDNSINLYKVELVNSDGVVVTVREFFEKVDLSTPSGFTEAAELIGNQMSMKANFLYQEGRDVLKSKTYEDQLVVLLNNTYGTQASNTANATTTDVINGVETQVPLNATTDPELYQTLQSDYLSFDY